MRCYTSTTPLGMWLLGFGLVEKGTMTSVLNYYSFYYNFKAALIAYLI